MGNSPKNVKSTPISSPADFRNRSTAPLELPSGLTIRCRRSTLPTLMKLGFVPNELMGVANKAMAKGSPDGLGSDVGTTPESIEKMMKMVDDVTVFAVYEPPIEPVPMRIVDVGGEEEVPLEEREEGVVYVDELDQQDKTFIYQYVVGGNRDLDQFRRESGGVVGSVSSS